LSFISLRKIPRQAAYDPRIASYLHEPAKGLWRCAIVARRISEVNPMRSDRPLIVSVLLLASGLALIIGYGTGNAAFNAAYPISAANLQLAITTTGPAALGGLVLTILGLLAMIWAFICAFVGPVQSLRKTEREVVRVEREPVHIHETVHPRDYVARETREYTPKI
jgi:hypothetical protein